VSRFFQDWGNECALFFAQDKNAGEGCTETFTHPVLFVPRQDRWNPFHVGEDLVTTFLALTLFSRHQSSSTSASTSSAAEQQLWTALPAAYAKTLSSSASSAKAEFSKLTAELAHEVAHTAGLQLVFTDDYLPTESLFAPLFDRMGAFPPRRMAVEGLGGWLSSLFRRSVLLRFWPSFDSFLLLLPSFPLVLPSSLPTPSFPASFSLPPFLPISFLPFYFFLSSHPHIRIQALTLSPSFSQHLPRPRVPLRRRGRVAP
jgi:hypothetical protein